MNTPVVRQLPHARAMRIFLSHVLLLASLWLAACAAEPPAAAPGRASGEAAAVRVDSAWARPAAQGTARTAVYFTLRNGTGAAARLTRADAEATGRAEIHRSTMRGGVMRMRPADTVAVDPGEAVAFAPGGYHVMLTDLARPLRPGDRFPLRLAFASGDTLTAQVSVRPQ